MWCCTMRETVSVCIEINPETLMIRTDLKLIFPIETLRVSKTGNTRLSKIYLYLCVPALRWNV